MYMHYIYVLYLILPLCFGRIQVPCICPLWRQDLVMTGASHLCWASLRTALTLDQRNGRNNRQCHIHTPHGAFGVCVCVCVCARARVHACVHVCMSTDVCVGTYISVCVYTVHACSRCVNVCMHHIDISHAYYNTPSPNILPSLTPKSRSVLLDFQPSQVVSNCQSTYGAYRSGGNHDTIKPL